MTNFEFVSRCDTICSGSTCFVVSLDCTDSSSFKSFDILQYFLTLDLASLKCPQSDCSGLTETQKVRLIL